MFDLVELQDADFVWMLGGHGGGRENLTLPPGGVDDAPILEHVRTITRNLNNAGFHSSWMMVSESEVVGLCGYKGAPRDGYVEIGYSVAPSRRRLGYATRAVAMILRAASADSNMQAVTAETISSNIASNRVLEANGFERTGTRIDPEEGILITWRKAVAASDSGDAAWLDFPNENDATLRW